MDGWMETEEFLLLTLDVGLPRRGGVRRVPVAGMTPPAFPHRAEGAFSRSVNLGNRCRKTPTAETSQYVSRASSQTAVLQHAAPS